MWINGIPYGEEHHEEACKVGAVMTLLNGSIRKLGLAQQYFTAHQTYGSNENEE